MKVDKSKWEKKTLGDLCTAGSSNIVVSKTQIGVGEYPLFGASGKVGNIDFYHNTEDYLGLVKDGSGVGRIDKYPAYSSLVGTMQYLYPTELANIDYLKYLISYLNLAKYVKGAAIPHIYYRHYKNEQIRVPNLLEQQSIASELDAIQSMIDGYKAQLEDLDELAKSIFLDMFGDPVENPKGWEKTNLSSICIKLSTGPFGTMLHKSDYCETGIPTINPQDIGNNKIVFESTAKISLDKAHELSNYILKQDDIILARRGDLSKCAVITENEEGWLCGTGSFFMKLKDLHPIIFYYQYKSDFIQNYLKEKSLGATMPNLNQKILNSLPVFMPPITLQQQFAAKIEAIESQKEKYKAQLADAEQLMAERMQYYFS